MDDGPGKLRRSALQFPGRSPAAVVVGDMHQMKPLKPLYTESTPPSYLGALFAYEGLFTVVMLIGASVLMSVYEHFKGNELIGQAIAWVAIAGGVCYFLVLPALFRKAAHLRNQHSYGFWEGLRYALMEWRLALAFLPVVGFLLAPPPPDKRGERDID